MPPPTAHTPSAANLGGPVIVPVTLVTVLLSKRQPNHRGVSDYTTIGVELHFYCRFDLKVMGFSHKKVFSRSTSSKNMVAFHTAASQTG